jgi:hypothetical protein
MGLHVAARYLAIWTIRTRSCDPYAGHKYLLHAQHVRYMLPGCGAADRYLSLWSKYGKTWMRSCTLWLPAVLECTWVTDDGDDTAPSLDLHALHTARLLKAK